MARAKAHHETEVVDEAVVEAAAEVTPEVAPEVTPEVTPEVIVEETPVVNINLDPAPEAEPALSAQTLAEMEAGRASIARFKGE